LTSSGMRGDAARCRELGIEGYLTKPVSESHLLETILTLFAAPAARARGAQPVTRHSLRESHLRLTVLLVEDNQVNQMLAKRLLENQGHQVIVATNGRVALTALERQAVDLILMDVQMPEMDGFEATGLIRQQEQTTGGHLPIIAMTAHAMKGDRERCLAVGMDDYVSKPIDPRKLFLVMQETLARLEASGKPVPGAGNGASVAHEAPPAAGRAEPVCAAPAVPATQPLGKALSPAEEAHKNASVSPAAPPAEISAAFDLRAALLQLEGNRELLAETARVLLSESPRQLQRLEQAVLKGDAAELEQTAHSL
jgi:CheY-like chemotaxis protein